MARLRTAYSEGRVTLEEFEERVKAAYAAKTYTQLDVVQQDLLLTRGPTRADPVRAYLDLRYRQLEWFRGLAGRPPGQRGAAALLVGPAAIGLWLVVNVAYLVICLALGLPADSVWFTLWPVIGAPWGSVVLTTEIFRRLDRRR
ncbi:hypothetical protein GCM10023192_16580 [Amycolatopsis samaneae]